MSDQGVASEQGSNGPSVTACDEAVRELYSFLDGELTDERRATIGQHLDQCAPCGSAAHFEAELRVVIADKCRDRVPASLVARVAETLDQEQVR